MTDIRAEVAGSIWKIERHQDDEVDKGQAIIIIEAMKMEIPVEAPVAGRIAQILVKEGDLIDEGDVLVRLATA